VDREEQFFSAQLKQLKLQLGKQPLVYSPVVVNFVYSGSGKNASQQFGETIPFQSMQDAANFADVLKQAVNACGGGDAFF
jgi:hypothetical protein